MAIDPKFNCGVRSNHRTYRDLSMFKMAAVCRLGLSKIRNFNDRWDEEGQLCHVAKFRGDWSNGCRDMEIYQFSRWQPSAILDLLCACLDHL